VPSPQKGLFSLFYKGLSRVEGSPKVMPLFVSPSLGDQVGLKGLVRIMPLSFFNLVPLLPCAAYSLAFAQGIEDRNIFYPFGIKKTPISCLLFLDLLLLLSFKFVIGESTPLNLFVSCNPSPI
jgi:hypothetical protein